MKNNNFSMSVMLYNTGEVFYNKFGSNSFELKLKNEGINVINSHRLVKATNLTISCNNLYRTWERNVLKYNTVILPQLSKSKQIFLKDFTWSCCIVEVLSVKI